MKPRDAQLSAAPSVLVDLHKVLQILINLIRKAKGAGLGHRATFFLALPTSPA